MTNQRRSRFLDVLTAEDLPVGATRVLETSFWFPRSHAASSPARSHSQVIDLASRRAVSGR